MFSNLIPLNVPIQGMPLITVFLFGATTIILAVVSFNENQLYKTGVNIPDDNINPINNNYNLEIENKTLGGNKKKLMSKKRKPNKTRQSKKRN